MLKDLSQKRFGSTLFHKLFFVKIIFENPLENENAKWFRRIFKIEKLCLLFFDLLKNHSQKRS